MGAVVSSEEGAARRRRLKIIIAVAWSLAVAAAAVDIYVDRRADEAQGDLRRRLAEAAPGLDHEEVLAAWYRFVTTPDAPLLLDELPTEDRIAVRAEAETVIAVYKAGFAGEDRCFDLLVGADDTEVQERSC